MGTSRANVGAFRVALLSALGLAPACDDERAPPCVDQMPNGSGFERCVDGTEHRVSVQACSSSLPRDELNVGGGPNSENECGTDADCTMRAHGHCEYSEVGDSHYCEYGCISDSECGDGVCICGSPVGHCGSAKCHTDDDCADGYVCRVYDPSNGCSLEALACQTADDACVTDEGCAPGELCGESGGKFVCLKRTCQIGRPFLVAGEQRTAPLAARSDWLYRMALDARRLDQRERHAAAEAWARMGLLEHASIAAFARFALQLLQLGAPPDLLQRTAAAMADETRHAQLAFGVATALSGVARGPAALDVADSLQETSLLEVTRLVIHEGCIGETAAALEAAEAAALTHRAELSELLSGIANDERRHAELAWSFVAWALEASPGLVGALLEAELSNPPGGEGDPPPDALAPTQDTVAEWGIVSEGTRRELKRMTHREVFVPCARALLVRAGGAVGAKSPQGRRKVPQPSR